MALPRILHHNILAQAASVVASSSAAGYPVANLSDGRPYTWWKPSAMNATIEVDAGVAVDADGLYIPAHTLDSTFCDVSVYAADLPFSGMQLLTAPEDFSNAAWSRFGILAFGAGSTINAVSAPDGTTTADLLTEDSTNARHYIAQTKTLVQGNTYTFQVYAKKNTGRDFITLSAAGLVWGCYNVATGSAVAGAGNANNTVLGASMVLEANGFYRCVATVTRVGADIAADMAIDIQTAVTTTAPVSYTGDGASGIYVWGAMLNLGSAAAPYVPVTAGRWISETALCYSNRIDKPENLGAVGTADVGISRTSNAALAPNGLKQSAEVSDGNAALTAGIYLSVNELHNAESQIRAAFFIRKTDADTHHARLMIYGVTGGVASLNRVVIDTNVGAVLSTDSSVSSYGIEDAGDFWWLWFTCDSPFGSGNSSVLWYFYPASTTSGGVTGEPAVTGGKIVWGASFDKAAGRPAPFREDAPLYLPFTETTKRYWLIRLNRKTGSALPAIGELVLGKALELPTGLPQGLDPVGRKVMGSRNNNERGQPMGRSVDFESAEYDITQEEIPWAWVRNVWLQAWRNGLRSEPFGFIWDYESHVEDVLLVTAAEEFRTPHKSGQRCTLRLRVQGVPT